MKSAPSALGPASLQGHNNRENDFNDSNDSKSNECFFESAELQFLAFPSLEMMPAHPPRQIVLVGLPGAGKSTAGLGLAKRLSWDFVDLDRMIEDHAHQEVAQIFAQRGEAAFRTMERAATAELRERTSLVVAAGGGWMSNPGASALLSSHARSIYLRVAPATALARLGNGISSRPLLLGPDPLRSLSELLDKRRTDYESADAVLDTEALDPQQVVESLLVIATNPGVK